MSDLGIIDLYEKSDKRKDEEFKSKIEGTLKVQCERRNITKDTEWIDIMELTIPYIDRIFKNPNRFIINEEEIVKIEQTKKVGVETIKHLSKNTNFIQKIDEKTGDVIPSKLLNVRKEESYNTYENRLIYTLVQNMKLFIKRRVENMQIDLADDKKEEKNDKHLAYTAKSEVYDEKIDVDVTLNSHLEKNPESEKKEQEEIMFRIENLKKNITSLTSSEVYKIIDKARITLVKEPIKKTNVVKKNVNFQYAMKLWDYLRDNFDEKSAYDENNEDYEDEGNLKELVNETFLLQYLAMKTLDGDFLEDKETRIETKNEMIGNLIDNMLDLDTEVNPDEILNAVVQKFEVIKYKKLSALKDLQEIFKKHIDKYKIKVEEE